MLAFFRKYEKTFLLIIFAPALLAMGITGTIMAVIQDPGDQVVGKLYGDEVTASEFFELQRMYGRTDDEESVWRFFALLRAAERAGMAVSDDELGKDIADAIRWDVAMIRAEDEVKKKGLDPDSEEGKREFQGIVLRYLSEAGDFPFTQQEYADAVRRRQGATVHEYERQRRRMALVQRYMATLREVAAVPPEQVWEAYQNEHHKRVLELIEVAAKDHLPTAENVTQTEVKAFYDRNRARYDIPRRVDLEYVALRFDRAEGEVQPPEWDELPGFLDAHRHELLPAADIDPVTTRTAADLLENVAGLEDKVRDAAIKARARARVAEVMEAVADAVDGAESEAGLDLKAVRDRVAEALKSPALTHGTTGLVTEDEAREHELIGSWPAERWFRTGEPGQVSDVLAGGKAWFVLRSREVEAARTPPESEVIEQVRKDYLEGAEWELKALYERDRTQRYLQDTAWRLEAVTADDEKFLEKTGGDAEKAHQLAKEALEQALEVARKQEWGRDFPLKRLETSPDVTEAPNLVYHELPPIEQGKLAEHEVLGEAAAIVPTIERKKVHGQPVERGDGKGWVVFKVVEQLPRQTLPFAEARDRVREDLRLARGLERARAEAERLLESLRGRGGEELTRKLAALNEQRQEKGLAELAVRKTEPFARDAVSLEGIPDAGRLVAEAFSAEAEVGGPFYRVEADEQGKRAYLLRVVERVDAPADGYANKAPGLRLDLLRKVRGDYAEAASQKVLLGAKGVGDKHVEYVTARSDGPDGATALELRQLFLPADRDTLERWLEQAALERLKAAQEEVTKSSWETAVDRFSEDEFTARRQGELPLVKRGDLVTEFGADFEERIFALARGEVSGPIKTARGYHLVRYVGPVSGRHRFQHVLIKTDAETRKLPAEVRARAEAVSREKLEAAVKRLEAGEAFVTVAEAVGDAQDEYGRGQKVEVDYTTAFERAALAQHLSWEAPEGSPEAADPAWVPEAVELPGTAGTSWHLLFTTPDRGDSRRGERLSDRLVYHIEAGSKDAIEQVRGELRSWLSTRAGEEGERPSGLGILERFKELARARSTAPTAAKGGAFGMVRLHPAVRPYGVGFLERITRRPDGTPVQSGDRSGVFQSEAGFHVVLVEEVVKPSTETELTAHRLDIGRRLLDGTDWN